MERNETANLRLISLGFVAIIAIAGLVLMLSSSTGISSFGDATITGNLAGTQRIGTNGVIIRSPYEACRALRVGNQHGMVPVWDGYYNKWNNLIRCVDPLDPTNQNKFRYVELAYKR